MKKSILILTTVALVNVYAGCCCSGTIHSRVNTLKAKFQGKMDPAQKYLDNINAQMTRLNEQLLPDIANQYSSEELESMVKLGKFNLAYTQNYYEANVFADHQQYRYQLKQVDDTRKSNERDNITVEMINNNISSDFLLAEESFFRTVKEIQDSSSKQIGNSFGFRNSESCLLDLSEGRKE